MDKPATGKARCNDISKDLAGLRRLSAIGKEDRALDLPDHPTGRAAVVLYVKTGLLSRGPCHHTRHDDTQGSDAVEEPGDVPVIEGLRAVHHHHGRAAPGLIEGAHPHPGVPAAGDPLPRGPAGLLRQVSSLLCSSQGGLPGF